MSDEKPRIGFVGVGGMGQAAHLRNYARLPECEVAAIAEVRPKLAERVARRWDVSKVYPSAEAMLAGEKLDGIVACQPFDRHATVIIPLYQAGIPIFTEKPLAASIADAERILTALKDSKSWHMVGYNKRSDPATMVAKAEIDRLKQSGELGVLKYVRITIPPGDFAVNGFMENVGSDDPWPELVRDSGAPGKDNPYIHQINMLRHLLGEPYSVSYADPTGVLLVAHTKSGACGTIEMAPYQTTVDWQESAMVCFDHGWVKLDLPAPLAFNRPGRVEIFHDPGNGAAPRTTIPQLPWVHSMRQQAVNFVRAIKGEIEPLCTAQEAIEDLRAEQQYFDLLNRAKSQDF